MQVENRLVMKSTVMRAMTSSPVSGDNGMVLLDLSLKLVAFDHGAAAILGNPDPSSPHGERLRIPKEILDTIRDRKSHEFSSIKTSFRSGDQEYVCRIYLVEPLRNLEVAQRMLVLHFERETSTYDPVHEFSIAYHLTERERQTLQGIALGLSGKQLADRMNISPNTVRVFLRLIMAKMGVSTRAEIVAKLLEGKR